MAGAEDCSGNGMLAVGELDNQLFSVPRVSAEFETISVLKEIRIIYRET